MNELSLFNTLFNDGLAFDISCGRGTGSMPKVDVKQTKDNYQFQIDLPGMTQDDIDISIKENTLTVASVQKEEKAEEKSEEKTEEKNREVFLIRERAPFSFKRSFTLPRDADSSNAEASFVNGVLSIKIARRPEEQSKKIAIKVA